MWEKQRLTSTEWEVCECLWESAPLTLTQIANRLTERTGWTRSTGEGAAALGAGRQGQALLPGHGPGGRGGPGDKGLFAEGIRRQRGAAGKHHGPAGGAEPEGDRPALRGPEKAGGEKPWLG